MGLPAAFRPGMRADHRLARVFQGSGVGRALVERHDHIGADLLFEAHDALGREGMLRAIQVRAEAYPVIADAAEIPQGENLIAPRIGEDAPLPAMKQ